MNRPRRCHPRRAVTTPAALLAAVTLTATGAMSAAAGTGQSSAPPRSAAAAGAAADGDQAQGADPARLAATASARAFTPTADAISVSTQGGGATFSYDPATTSVGTVLAASGGGSLQWSPGGDVLVTAGPTSWTTYDREFQVLADLPRTPGSVTPGWFPTGDGFIEQTPGRTPATLARSMSPTRVWSQPLPTGSGSYGRFAVSPYGSEAVTRSTTSTGSNLYLVPLRSPMTLTGQNVTAPVRDYFVSAYRPGDPAVAQEPGKGVKDAGARTFVAFLGVEPGTTRAKLFVDYQDGRRLDQPLEPTAVTDAGAPCVTSAPAFSPDRRQIAFLTGVATSGNPCSRTAVRVVTLGPDGRYGANAKTILTSSQDNPYVETSWRARTAPAQVVRIGGDNRYQVAVNVSRSVFADGAAKGAVVAGGDAYADALAGSPLAAALKGPLMLTQRESIYPAVVSELTRALAKDAPIYVLGGEASVSEAVLASLRATGHPVTRIGGANRFAVATGVAGTIATVRGYAPQAIFVANGRVFPDALVASPAATATRGVIVLSDGDVLPAETRTYLAGRAGTRLYGIGGGGARSLAGQLNVEVVSGADRFEVAKRVADRFFTAEWIATIVSGDNWPDATTGGAVISQWQQPILLSRGDQLPSPVAARLDGSRSATELVVAFGGPNSVDPAALGLAGTKAGTQTLYYGPDAPR